MVSIGSVNWTSNGSFLHLHRSQYDPSKNQYTTGRIEEFNRTDLKIDWQLMLVLVLKVIDFVKNK